MIQVLGIGGLIFFFALMTLKTDVASGVYSWEDPSGERTGENLIIEGETSALSRLLVSSVRLAADDQASDAQSNDDFEELVIVKSGKVTIDVAGNRQELGPGSVAVILPGEEYIISNHEEVSAEYFHFQYQSKAGQDRARADSAGGSIVLDWNDVAYRETEKGGRRQQFDRPTSMLERFEMHTTTLNAGLRSHPPHSHREEEFILVLEGEVEEFIDDKLYRAVPGDLIFLAAESMHTIQNIGDAPATYFAFKWE